MRNLKKFLALVLAMVMAFSLMLSASAASDTYDKYPDKDSITDEFKEAVQVLGGLDVMAGDDKGFRPGDTLTRAEAAVIIYRVATGDVANNQTDLYKDYATFADMSHDDWFAGYVGFCQNAGYIKGTSPTTFSPYLPVTGYEMLAMLLRVVGYGKNNEFTGGTWQVNVAALAESLHVTDTVKEANFASTLNRGARRDVVAELTFQTLTQVPTVTYSTSLQYSDRDSLLGTSLKKNPTLGQKIFGLFRDATVDAIDEWGRPGYYWVKDGVPMTNGYGVNQEDTSINPNPTGYYDTITGLPVYTYKTGNADTPSNASKLIATIRDEALITYHTKTIECDIAHDLEWTSNKTISSAYIDGVRVPAASVVTDSKAQIAPLDTTNYLGGHGRILEIYDMSLGDKRTSTANKEEDIRVVEINTYLAQVNKVSAAGTDKNEHPYKATIDLLVHSGVGNDHSSLGSATTRDGQGWANLNWHIASHDSRNVDDSGHRANHEVWDFDGITVEDGSKYTVGQYVLVYVNCANEASVYATVNASSTNDASIVEDYIRNAEIKTGGFVMSWTDCAGINPDKTLVGTTNYEDSDKFCLNWRVKNVPYSVAVDEYGYAIGLVNMSQYLVIEKIEWKQSDTIGGGYALMDAVTSGGEKVSGVRVSSINNLAPMNTGDTLGVLNAGTNASGVFANGTTAPTVSDYYTNNNQYYTHIFSYDVDGDGSYTLRHNCIQSGTAGTSADTQPAATIVNNAENVNGWTHLLGTTANPSNPYAIDVDAGIITKGEATIRGSVGGNINTYVATDNTVFVVLNTDGYTYTVYTGKNNVPSITGANLCIVTSGGYANMVVVRNGTRVVRSDVFSGYVPSLKPVDGQYINGTYCYGYDVYPLGETSSIRIYENGNTFSSNATMTGFYRFQIDDNNQVQQVSAIGGGFMDSVIASGSSNAATLAGTGGNGTTWDSVGGLIARQRIQNVVSGYSIQTAGYGALAANTPANTLGIDNRLPNGYSIVTAAAGTSRDFSLSADTKVIKLGMNVTTISDQYHFGRLGSNDATADVSVSTGSMADLTRNSIVWVYYTTRTDPATQQVIYDASAIYVLTLSTAPSTDATVNVVLNVINSGTGYTTTVNAGSYSITAGTSHTTPSTAAALQSALGASIDPTANNYLNLASSISRDTATISSPVEKATYTVTYSVMI